MKTLNFILSIIMSVFVGVFIGHAAYILWSVKAYPEIYAIQSAPWYTSILLYGAVSIGVCLICLLVKLILNRCKKD